MKTDFRARSVRAATTVFRTRVTASNPGHNFMAGFTDFEHFQVADDLDFASWDAYPLGFLSSFPLFSEGHRKRFLRSGDPDYGPFHHDLYRACGRGRWWVMEHVVAPLCS